MVMLLLIEPSFDDSKVREEISEFITNKGKLAPEIYCYNIDASENMYNVLANIDCLITTHTAWSMKCLDYASEYEVKHRYIMDTDILSNF